MIRNGVSFNRLLLPLLLFITMLSTFAVSQSGDQNTQPATPASAKAQQPAPDVKGTWSGTFFSKHSNVPPFTLTVVMNPDSNGRLIGTSTLNSDCLKDVRLEVAVTGSKIVLAGSDDEGDNITVRGTIDKTGTLVNANYILNGSATGRCETDNGTATLAKR